MKIRWLCLALVLSAASSIADEQVRAVQEELRKRNLYFGDVDGLERPELANALKRYQARKGFAVTGSISDETATSLNVAPSARAARRPPALPNVPVLRSDRARDLPPEQRVALEEKVDLTPSPPAESPPPAQESSAERIQALIEQYLRDSEGGDIAAQTRYFAYPVEYFDHGPVEAAFVQKDVENYLKRWPQRKYALEAPVALMAKTPDGKTHVAFPIAFQVRNNKHTAQGRTRNHWTLREENGELKIVAIREERLRE